MGLNNPKYFLTNTQVINSSPTSPVVLAVYCKKIETMPRKRSSVTVNIVNKIKLWIEINGGKSYHAMLLCTNNY